MSDRIVLKNVERIPTEKFHREWGCPLTKNRTPWCFGMCEPVDGHGICGRIAPHSLVGRTDGAIARYLERQAQQQ